MKLLAALSQIPEKENTPIANVMSASTSKGMEFERVILYKFGENVPESFRKAIDGKDLSDSDYIELAHFFNKLYVAATRARSFLFILDTENGIENFWKYLMNDTIAETFMNEDKYWESEKIEYLVKGQPEQKHELKETHPEETAKEYENRGMLEGSFSLLLRAQQYFKLIGEEKDALRCEAWAYYFKEDDWEKTGEKFEELNMIEKSSESYWKGKAWLKLFNLHNDAEEKLYKKRRILAGFMLAKFDIDDIKENNLFEDCDNKDESWETIVSHIAGKLKGELTKEREDFVALGNFSKKLAQKGFKDFYDFAAKLYFKAHSFEMAVRCWETIGKTDKSNTEYLESKLELARDKNDVNTIIECYHNLRKDQELIGIWQKTKNSSSLISPRNHRIIFNILLKSSDFDSALSVPDIDLETKVTEGLNVLKSLYSKEVKREQKKKLFDLLLDSPEGIEILKDNIETFQEFFDSKEALRRILKNPDWESILKSLDRVLRTSRPGRFIETFVDVVCDNLGENKTEHLFYAIDLVGELKEKLAENVKLIKALAKSRVIPRMFKVEERARLENFITKCVWGRKGWENLMTFKEIGAALERVGAKSITLQNDIYDFLIQNSELYDNQLVEWAKKRWIIVGQKRANYEKQQGNKVLVRKIEKDFRRKMREWNLEESLLVNEPEFPEISAIEKEEKFTYANVLEIRGLKQKPEINEKRQRVIILLEDFEIRVNCLQKRISVQDQIEDLTVSVDLESQKVGGLELNIESANGIKKFSGANNSFSGILHEDLRLELSIEGNHLDFKFLK
jgi:hypothetical protein